MTDAETAPGFAAAYSRHRGTLYRALVLITGNRDLATEAVDRGFSRWHRRLRRAGDEPAAQVLRQALRWARRRSGGRRAEIQGFRLPGSEVPARGHEILERFDRLDLDDRSILTLRHYLGWDDDAVAAVSGRDPEEVPARLAAVEARVAPDGAVLGDVLAEHAATFPEPLARMESSRRRGAAQRVATVLGLGVLAVAGVGGTALGVAALVDGGPDPAEVGPGTTIAVGALEIDPAEVDWVEVPLGVRQGDVGAITYGPAGFAVLVHDYSRGNGQTLVMLSEDGLDWTGGMGPQTPEDGWVGYLVAPGDRYVALGSSWSRPGGGETPVVWTSPDGVEWATSELASDDSLEVDGRVIPLSTSAFGIAGDASGLTVFGSQNGEVDVMGLLQDVLPPEASTGGGWTIEGDEILIMDRDGSVTSRLPAADLGVDPQLLSLLQGGRPVIWTSDDGSEWTREYPELPGGEGFSWVARAGDAVAAVVYGRFGAEMWVTARDGTWDHADLPATATVSGVTTIEGRLVAYGSAGAAAAIWTSDDGVTWQPTGDGAALGGLIIDTLLGSADGVVALARGNPAAGLEPVVIGLDEFEVTVHNDGRLVVTDADGATVADIAGEDLATGEDGSIVIPDPETGEPLVSIGRDEVDIAREKQLGGLMGSAPDVIAADSSLVLLSTDLEHWTAISLSDTIGGSFYPNSAAFNGDTVVLTGWRESGPFDSTGPSPAVWVADLTGD